MKQQKQMTKFKVLDKVRIYDRTGVFTGVVVLAHVHNRIYPNGLVRVYVSETKTFELHHPQQLRRLKPRARALKRELCAAHGRYRGLKPNEFIPVPDWTQCLDCIDEHLEAISKKPPSYDQSQVEKAKRPKARTFWIETPSCGKYKYWETIISNSPDEDERKNWIKVREVIEGEES